MPRGSGSDFIIDVLLETGGADRVLDDLKKKINGLAKDFSTVQKTINKNTMDNLRTEREKVKLKKDELALEKQRLVTERAKQSAAKKSFSEESRLAQSRTTRRSMFALDRSISQLERSPFGRTQEGRDQAGTLRAQLNQARVDLAKGGTKDRKFFEQFRSGLDQIREGTVRAKDASTAYNKTLRKQNVAVKGLSDSLHNLARAYFSVFFVLEGGRQFLTLSTTMEDLNVTMQAAFGNAAEGAKEMEFVKKVSMDLGTSLEANAKGYAQIAMAAKQAKIPMEDSRELFTNIAETSRAFGLSVDDQKGVMRAFTQMLGKQQIMA